MQKDVGERGVPLGFQENCSLYVMETKGAGRNIEKQQISSYEGWISTTDSGCLGGWQNEGLNIEKLQQISDRWATRAQS